ncbi:MAG: alpha/beta hydrolase family protein [Opitutaceae bacterium]|nr:alpha/beta hydrolase family protein [Opitutaceae bacterium]
MSRRLLIAAGFISLAASAAAQERATSPHSKGGTPLNSKWEGVPPEFRESLKLPEWPLPNNRSQWERDRAGVRSTLVKLMGDLPARPDPRQVRVVSTEDRGGFTLEKIEFHNGADAIVPGYVMLPKSRPGTPPARRPCIVLLHEHGGSKDSVCLNLTARDHAGTQLVEKGFIVAAIDSYFHGERIGRGPAGAVENKAAQEMSFSKINLWLGRSLWGMQVRDEQCLLDYLVTRPDINPDQIGASGMSMGSTRSWWLAAVDDRIKAIVGVVCFTRYTELIEHGYMRYHGIYYFVPGMLQHFDTEAIHALVAPRPHLELSGDQDPGTPFDGVETLERKVGAIYRLYGQPENFRSVVWKNTGHEYLPVMRERMIAWFEKHLPVK